MKGFTLKTKADFNRFNYNMWLAQKLGIYTFEDLDLFIKHKQVINDVDLSEKLYQECNEVGVLNKQ